MGGAGIKRLVAAALPPRWLIRLQAADHYLNGEPELRLVSRLCDPARNAVDIGANIGVYTYFLRRHARHVFAFEPNPELAALLRLKFPSRVTVIQAAVSDRSGTAVFHVPVVAGKSAHELGSLEASDAAAKKLEVPMVRLDDNDCGDVGFLKIDVERHDQAVLRGAAETIRRCLPNILIEVTPLLYGKPLREVFAPLTGLGYRAYFSFAGQYLPFERFDQDTHADPARFGKPNQFMGTNMIFTRRPMRF
jgi:FkbM family methyltransferase